MGQDCRMLPGWPKTAERFTDEALREASRRLAHGAF